MPKKFAEAPPKKGEKAPAIQGRIPDPPKSKQRLLEHDPSPNFLLMCHPRHWAPQSWEEPKLDAKGEPVIDETGKPVMVHRTELLPRITKMMLDPGVGGVRDDGSDLAAREGRSAKGYRFVEHDEYPGQPQSYVRVYDVVGGKLHLEAWELPSPRKNITKRDDKAYIAFLQWVADKLPDPLPEDFDAHRDLVQARIDRRAERVATSPSAKAKTEADEITLDAIARKVDELQESAHA